VIAALLSGSRVRHAGLITAMMSGFRPHRLPLVCLRAARLFGRATAHLERDALAAVSLASRPCADEQ
jgi:hypothetical protein